MNFVSAADRLASFMRPDIVLDPTRCFYSTDRFSSCQACYDVCLAEAILPGKPPRLDENKCQGCSACLPVCPREAFQSNDTIEPLMSAVKRGPAPELDLFCTRNPNGKVGPAESAGYRVEGCLAGLGAGSYMRLVSMGFRRVSVRLDACQDCPWSSLSQRVEGQVDMAKKMLAMWGKEDALVSVAELDQPLERPLWDKETNQKGISRRDFFRTLIPIAQENDQADLQNKRAIANGERLGRERLRLLQATVSLDTPAIDSPEFLERLDFATLTISEECTVCQACARVCPTRAIRYATDQAETRYQLNFLAEACIGCEACLHVCNPAAIHINHTPLPSEVFASGEVKTLWQGKLARCERCHGTFGAQEGKRMCPSCEYRASHPFGSMFPINGKGMPIPPEKKEK